MARGWQLQKVQFIPRPISEVFEFFSNAANLERLTPKTLRFRILTPLPVEMRKGCVIDYTIRLYGAPIRWRTRIDSYEPEERFSDTQLEGPYRYWHHLHEFTSVEGGTRMYDIVDYEVPFGPLGVVARTLFVRRSLEQIFSFRRQAIAEIFGSEAGNGVLA